MVKREKRNVSLKIAELMQVPAPAHDEAWLKHALQAAIELELSTILDV
jgi:hypothetical protein